MGLSLIDLELQNVSFLGREKAAVAEYYPVGHQWESGNISGVESERNWGVVHIQKRCEKTKKVNFINSKDKSLIRK